MATIDPSQSLYLSNINGRVTPEELKKSLYALFSTYGSILDITVKKNQKMREQAFVVYNNVASATTAMRSLNGFTFFSKPLKIEYAKTKSDIVAKMDGTYRMRTFANTGANATSLGKRGVEDGNEGSSKMARTESSDDDSDDHA